MQENPNDNDPNPFRYCGEYWDKETKTYYLRARSYDPRTSRMLSEDPVTSISRKMPNNQELIDSLSLNRYTYCANNPIIHVDPSGHNYALTATVMASCAWMPFADFVLPVGDIVYVIIVAGTAIAETGMIYGPAIANWATTVGPEMGNAINQGKEAVSRTVDSIKQKLGGGSSSGSPPPDPNNWNHRNFYLEQAQNKELRNAISELYRKTAEVGDGGTADMLRHAVNSRSGRAGKSSRSFTKKACQGSKSQAKTETLSWRFNAKPL